MPALSKHYALLDFDPGNPLSVPIEPISVDVTVDEAWAPYCQATVIIPNDVAPYELDPRNATFLGLRLQQDFGDLIYNKEITADYAGDVSAITAAFGGDVSDITRAYSKPWNVFETALPISTVTAAYGGDVSDLTAADLMEVWRMSDFLHSSGTFNPAPSTIFDGYLMLRKVTKDYVTKQTTLELTSHEAILQDSIGYPSDLIFTYTSLRSIINYVLSTTIGAFTQLQPGAADYTYSPAYGFAWYPNQTAWDILNALVTAANLVLYCDEKGDWYLNEVGATSGDLYLKDDDNITTLSTVIDRNSPSFFDYAVVEYIPNDNVPSYDTFGTSGFDISKDAYFKIEGMNDPGGNAAQSLVWRAETRGIIYSVEAISNYDARPRQNMTIDITDEAVKTAIIQSISWSLPSARMSVDIRDLQEVI
jgi:hypothetical protein